jgi:hypothetical protein
MPGRRQADPLVVMTMQPFPRLPALVSGWLHAPEYTMPTRFLTSAALLALMAGTALAAPMSAEDKAVLQQQCAGDFTTFCGDLPPEDGPETQACFEKNMAKLSPGCQGAIQSFKQGKKG